MTPQSPIRKLLETHAKQLVAARVPVVAASERPGAASGRAVSIDDQVETLPYATTGAAPGRGVELVASYGSVELEYAALRRAAGLFDGPHRGTLVITGNDRIEFLNRMLTQNLKAIAPGQATEAFWLNRKGRVEGDLLLAELGDRVVVDLDIHQADHVRQTLGAFIITEEVEIEDASERLHTMALHGPGAIDALREVGRPRIGASDQLSEWTDATLASSPAAASIVIAGREVVVIRRDQIGAAGFELIMAGEDASKVCAALLDLKDKKDQPLVRPVGWYAWNIARIEAGTPLMNIDFSTESLPAETGVLDARVSFTKGCYLGQEIVARMRSLGKPKQQLIGVRIEEDALPIAGAQVFAAADPMNPIGVVTSSTLSPMLGGASIALAMIKSAFADVGTKLIVNAEGRQAPAVVTALPFWGGPKSGI